MTLKIRMRPWRRPWKSATTQFQIGVPRSWPKSRRMQVFRMAHNTRMRPWRRPWKSATKQFQRGVPRNRPKSRRRKAFRMTHKMGCGHGDARGNLRASASSLINASDRLLAVEAAIRAACSNPLLRSWRMGASLLVPRSGVAPASTLEDVLVVVTIVAAVGVACGCAGSHCKRFPLGGLKANPPGGPTPRLRPRRRGGILRKLLLNQDDCC